ncbi:hypothetical protein A3H65_01920 [Candidatus Giovannonibacteria bacterium RIFCSPLOWO2_02_FULL_45_14]|nr:MAG: hypothetical protein A3H65_01920 [Candidatus Giovannonibacteria bacterium RIFCSPLOWO2_02_FULL_45_14]
MKAEDVLCATSKDGTVVLTGNKTDKIIFVGSNFSASVDQGAIVNSLSLSISENKYGLVALAVSTKRFHGKEYPENVSFLLPAARGFASAFVDLENPWVSPSDCLAQILYIDYEHFLQVKVGEEIFSSSRKSLSSGVRRVDVTELCKYLAGDIKLEELEAAAIEHVAEESAQAQLAKAKAEIERKDREYWDYITAATEKYNKVAKENKLLQERIEARDLELSRLRPSHKAAVDLANALSKDWQWCLRTETVVALANFSRIIGIDFSRHK